MLTKDLKITAPAKEILWLIIQMRRDAPRYLVHGLLAKMQDTAERIINRINYANRANTSAKRIEYITQLLSEQGTLESYVEFCVEHDLFQGLGGSLNAKMLPRKGLCLTHRRASAGVRAVMASRREQL